MEYPNGYYEANNNYPETPHTRKRPYENAPEVVTNQNNTHYYQDGYHQNYYDQNGYYNMNTSDSQYESFNTSNQTTMENSWGSAPAPPQYHDYSQRRTPPINTNYSAPPGYTNMQTPVTYGNGNSSVSNSLMFTPESDTSSNQSEYFGAPMTAAQYQHHLHKVEMQRRMNSVVPPVQTGQHSFDQSSCHPSVAPLPNPVKDLLKKLPIEDLEMIRNKRKFDEEIQKPQPYYHNPMPNDEVVLDVVDGRMPIVLDSTKFDLLAEELRRRLAAPEFINKSSLFSFFRISKRKDGSNDIQNLLNKCNLTVKPGQRHLPESMFTFLLERETLRLAQSFDFMYRETCPVELLAWKLLEKYTSEGTSFESCQSTAEHAAVILRRMLSLYRDTQPKVSGIQESYKKTKFDEKFARLSLLTHGFLHPHSITNFATLLKVFEKTAEISGKVQRGEIEMREIEELRDDEKPFEVMSDSLFEYWKRETTSSAPMECEPDSSERAFSRADSDVYEDEEDEEDEELEEVAHLLNDEEESDEDSAELTDDKNLLAMLEGIEEPLLEYIDLLTENKPELHELSDELYVLLKDGNETEEKDVGLSDGEESICTDTDVEDYPDDDYCYVERETETPVVEDTQSVPLPQPSDDELLDSVEREDFDKVPDVESLIAEVINYINDMYALYIFVVTWEFKSVAEPDNYDSDALDDKVSNHETPDNDPSVHEAAHDDTPHDDTPDDDTSDNKASDDDDEQSDDDDADGKSCHSQNMMPLTEYVTDHHKDPVENYNVQNSEERPIEQRSDVFSQYNCEFERVGNLPPPSFTSDGNHTAEMPPFDSFSNHAQEVERPFQSFQEPWSTFVPPSDDQLRQMTYEELSTLPVPAGEHYEYWHDKALNAHYNERF